MLDAVSAATFFHSRMVLDHSCILLMVFQHTIGPQSFQLQVSVSDAVAGKQKMLDAVSAATFFLLSPGVGPQLSSTKSMTACMPGPSFQQIGVMMPALYAHSLPHPRVMFRSEVARCVRLDADDLT
jgi:hypothetical protein